MWGDLLSIAGPRVRPTRASGRRSHGNKIPSKMLVPIAWLGSDSHARLDGDRVKYERGVYDSAGTVVELLVISETTTKVKKASGIVTMPG